MANQGRGRKAEGRIGGSLRLILPSAVRLLPSSSLLRKMNPQHSVVVLRDDLLVEDVLGELDLAAEGAVVDFHDVHAHAARGAVIALDLVATRDGAGALERHL